MARSQDEIIAEYKQKIHELAADYKTNPNRRDYIRSELFRLIEEALEEIVESNLLSNEFTFGKTLEEANECFTEQLKYQNAMQYWNSIYREGGDAL
jgi:hypothetical protein